jgi:hypothetical protein
VTHPKILVLLLLLPLLPSLVGCQSGQDTLELDTVAFFTFKGNTEDALVTLTLEDEPVWTEMKVVPKKHYIFKADCYDVLVTRKGKVVLQRTIFLGNGLVFEVLIP